MSFQVLKTCVLGKFAIPTTNRGMNETLDWRPRNHKKLDGTGYNNYPRIV